MNKARVAEAARGVIQFEIFWLIPELMSRYFNRKVGVDNCASPKRRMPIRKDVTEQNRERYKNDLAKRGHF